MVERRNKNARGLVRGKSESDQNLEHEINQRIHHNKKIWRHKLKYNTYKDANKRCEKCFLYNHLCYCVKAAKKEHNKIIMVK